MPEKEPNFSSEVSATNSLLKTSLAQEMKEALDPRLIVHSFMTAPVMTPKELLRDAPAFAITIAGGLLLSEAMTQLHERFNLPVYKIELLVWTAATLAFAAVVSHYHRKFFPGQFNRN